MSREEIARQLGVSMDAIVEMPPIPREAFSSDEDWQRAVQTSQSAQPNQPWSTLFIPDEHLEGFTLYLINHTTAVGMGVLHDRDADLEQVRQILKQGRRRNSIDQRDEIDLDYVNGRPIKFRPLMQVEGGWNWDTDLYNRIGAWAGEKHLAMYLDSVQ